MDKAAVEIFSILTRGLETHKIKILKNLMEKAGVKTEEDVLNYKLFL